MIPRFKPALGWGELIAAFHPPRANDIEQFEGAFAAEMGQKFAVAFPYGRTGLILLLEAMGLKGKEIICPAYTCVVVPHAIVYSGNEPVFVDSQESDFNMNLELVPEAVTENTGAIIATSIFGYPVDLDKLDALRARFPHLKIIQDCAHSFAAEWRGRPVQLAGDAAFFGLNISKLMTSIFGGMVTTDNEALAASLRTLRDQRLKRPSLLKSVKRLLYLLAVYPAFWEPFYGLVNRLERSGLLDAFVRYYDETKIDMPPDYLEMMTPLEARVGRVQVGKYREIVERHRQNAATCDQAAQELSGLEPPPLVEGATYSHYVPRVAEREQLVARMLRKGIQLGQLIEYSIPEMAAYIRFRSVPENCPTAKIFPGKVVNFPTWQSPAHLPQTLGDLKFLCATDGQVSRAE